MESFRWISLIALLALCLAGTVHAQDVGPNSDLQKIYADESHCLLDNELRNVDDQALSCSCRDALVQARYIYKTYFTTGKDPNLDGVYVEMGIRALRVCGKDNSKFSDTGDDHWNWNGPEVIRTYLTDSEVERFPPDDSGWRRAPYSVKLIFHDEQGRVTKVELYTSSQAVSPKWKPNKQADNQ